MNFEHSIPMTAIPLDSTPAASAPFPCAASVSAASTPASPAAPAASVPGGRRAALTVGANRPQLPPDAAALAMQDEFLVLARWLSPRDRATRDDLVQEMSLAVLLCSRPHTHGFFRAAALWRARKWLRSSYRQTTRDDSARDRTPVPDDRTTRLGEILARILKLD